MIALLRQVANPGDCEGALWAGMRIHRIASAALAELGYSSKLNAEWEFLCMLRDEGRAAAAEFLAAHGHDIGRRSSLDLDPLLRRRLTHGPARHPARPRPADLARLPGLEHSAARAGGGDDRRRLRRRAHAGALDANLHGRRRAFLAQFFPIFLLGALFGRLMDDSGSVAAIARFMTETAGTHRAILAVVLAGALVTYGGVSLFVAFFVLAPMAMTLFQGRRDPAPADACGHRARHVHLHHVGAARARPPSRTRSRCRSSAPPPSPRRASVWSPPPSCSASACGGSAGPKPCARKGEGS